VKSFQQASPGLFINGRGGRIAQGSEFTVDFLTAGNKRSLRGASRRIACGLRNPEMFAAVIADPASITARSAAVRP
jgi:hypothetical protein